MKTLFLEQFMIILSILLIILCMLMPLKNEGIFQKYSIIIKYMPYCCS